MKKIKILHILHSVGGVDTSLRMIIGQIDASKTENIIIHGVKDNGNFIDSQGNSVREYLLPIERDIHPFKDLKCLIKALLIVRKEKPDIIHGHSAKGGLIANFLGYFLKSKPVYHTPQAYSYLSTSNKLKKQLFIFIERVMKNRNSILLACSESELKRGLVEVKYPKDKVLLFNNCINEIQLAQDNSSINNFYLPENYICTVGRPSYQKNIELMIEIIKEVKISIPDIHLVVMGVGVVSPNTENVKRLISEYNLDGNITLIDWIERDKILEIVSKSKFYISTARYEGLPYAIIESLALKKAIIATNCDGNRDLVIDEFNGYLIDAERIDLFVDKCIKLYVNDEIRNGFEKNSFSYFKEKFDLKVNIYSLEKIYINGI